MMPVLSCLDKQLMRPNKENYIFVTFSASSPITKSPNCFNCECGGTGLSVLFRVIRHSRPFHLCELQSVRVDLHSYASCLMVTKWILNSRPCVPRPGKQMGEGRRDGLFQVSFVIVNKRGKPFIGTPPH